MAEGQFLGERATYIYLADSGTSYLITLDKTLGDIAELGLTAATTANAAGLSSLPKGLRTRYLLWQGVCDGRIVRKKLTANASGTAYIAPSSTVLDISGSTEGKTTGRVGEKFTFQTLPTG